MRLTSRLLRVLIPLVITVSIGAFVALRYVRSSDELHYEVITVRKGDLTQQVLAAGTLNPLVTLEIGTQVSGTVKELFVDNNSPVKKGQLLALIDPEILEAQAVQAEANLALEKALQEKLDVQFKEDELNLRNIRALFEAGANVAKRDLDASETSYNLTRAQQKAQEARIAQCEGAINVAKISLARARIISPIDGVVLSRNIEPEQIVVEGSRSPLFVVSSTIKKMKLEINISEADISHLQVGQEVSFTVDAYPDRRFIGKVKEIRLGPLIQQNVVYYGVVANIDNAALLLRPGMTADVRITTAYHKDALLIPLTVVKQKDDRKYVEVLEGKQRKQKEVTTGLKNGNGLVQVLSGLQEGEKLVLSPVAK